MIFNVSKGFKNRLQLLTKRRPRSECNTTVAAMGCIYMGHTIPSPDGIMPEDYIMDILDSEEGRSYLQFIVPGARYNPWNDSKCIAWATNKAVGKQVCRVEKLTMDKMKAHIYRGGAVGIGGGFVKRKGTSGHFVCVVGVQENGDLIIDDPYGNFLNYYRDQNGNDLTIPLKQFIKLTFGRSKKKTMQIYLK